MNRIHQSIWNDSSGTFVAASESTRTSAGQKISSRTAVHPSPVRFAVKALSACLMLAFGATAYALPQGGVVAPGGAATIASDATSTICLLYTSPSPRDS